MKCPLSIYDFGDYRGFMSAHFEWSRIRNSQWSYQAFAHHLNLSGNTSILKIIKGHREAGPKIIRKLIAYYDFNVNEAQFFTKLVQLSKSKGDSATELMILNSLRELSPRKEFHLLNDKEFSALSQWWFYAIRQMSKMKGFIRDPNWISSKLSFKVTPRQIEDAIETMLKLNLIDFQDNQMKLKKYKLTTSDGIASEAIKSYHETMLDNAKSMLRSEPISRRQFLAHTITVNKSSVKEAKKVIEDFLYAFEKRFEVEEGDSVYQIQTQFFPMTSE